MNFKKRVNGSWTDTSHYVHSTSTDTLTTLPAVLYPNDTTATVGLKGNMYQASGVSPTTPIQPQETGDKTANLCPETSFNKTTELYHAITFVEPLPVGAYTISANITPDTGISSARLSFRKSDLSQEVATNITIQTGRSTVTITISNPCSAIYFYGGTTVMDNIPIKYDDIMLNLGSTALPYEPYGYKIPISSASTTMPVYLGEIESTRRIKKLVLTGQEETINFYKGSTNGVGAYLNRPDMLSNSRQNGFSTHFLPQSTPSGSQIDGVTFGASNTYVFFTFSSDTATALNLTDLNSIKAWFQQQYAAGTPVTVWYVLATEETGIVNEPLRKIGNYADEVSGITIPTIAGANTLSIGTTLQPSEVTVNYKGWHPVADVHEADNGAWT